MQIKKLPKNSCNAHLHIIDPRFPNDGKAENQKGTIEEYKNIASQLGLDRAVFVQAKPFGRDNSCLLDAIAEFGYTNCVGIGVVNNQISDDELEDLNLHGIRGLRFSVWNPENAVVSFSECFPLSERIKSLGWNVQLHMSSKQFLDSFNQINQIQSKIVIDHMGRLDNVEILKNLAFKKICKLIDKGNTWVKLSGPYLNCEGGYPWNNVNKIAKAFIEYAPERIVWGSDWPHVTEKTIYKERQFIDVLGNWVESENVLQKILVKNPVNLYGFK